MEATVHTVAVGATNGSLLFFPYTIIAAVGDTVQFQFHPANHSVTESDFGTPYQPKSSGLYSGFNPVAANAPVYVHLSC
jgi:plastocyanin